jgi:hypothetical protein
VKDSAPLGISTSERYREYQVASKSLRESKALFAILKILTSRRKTWQAWQTRGTRASWHESSTTKIWKFMQNFGLRPKHAA